MKNKEGPPPPPLIFFYPIFKVFEVPGTLSLERMIPMQFLSYSRRKRRDMIPTLVENIARSQVGDF